MSSPHRFFWSPVLITALGLAFYLGAVLVRSGNDPYAFVRIGSQYQAAHAVDEQGYDGQFVFFIARDLSPEASAPFLDTPAYRYQRILYPLVVRAAALGNANAIPWVMVWVAAVAHLLSTAVLERLLVQFRINRWYALAYGLFPGVLLAVRLALPEPLAYLLVLTAFLVPSHRKWLRWILLCLALFAKETTILFLAAQLLVYLKGKDRRSLAGLAVVTLVPYAGFQVWLSKVFGAPGIGSGGAMATPFEWVPFMGFFRIGAFGLAPLLIFGALIVPFVFYPAVWGLVVSIRDLVGGKMDLPAAVLLCNAAIIPFLPFSTVREPGGLLRFSCGLVIAVLVYAAARNNRRALNYSLLWMALNAILING